jgi:hypothetical protein
MMKSFVFGLVILAAFHLTGCQTTSEISTSATPTSSTAVTPNNFWKSSIVRDEKGNVVKRFIPVEMFTGAKWNGSLNLTISTAVDILQNRHKSMHVRSPVKGFTGNMVISRVRTSRGRIYQEFEINQYGDGLAMTYQNRRVRISGRPVTENKFPIGWWKPGESRRYCGRFNTQLTIRDLDYGGVHGITFHWKMTCSKDCESVYVFLPERGLDAADIRPHSDIVLPDLKRACDN